MRYKPNHKDTKREQILEVASHQFRENGIAASGLSGVMKGVSLTNGAFYSHFTSKDDLILQSLESCLDDFEAETFEQLGASSKGLIDVIRGYLSEAHRDHPAHGCPTAALIGEIGRASLEIRQAYTQKLETFISTLARSLSSDSPSHHRQLLSVFALLVGSLQLARAVVNPKMSAEILKSGISSAVLLLERTEA